MNASAPKMAWCKKAAAYRDLRPGELRIYDIENDRFVVLDQSGLDRLWSSNCIMAQFLYTVRRAEDELKKGIGEIKASMEIDKNV